MAAPNYGGYRWQEGRGYSLSPDPQRRPPGRGSGSPSQRNLRQRNLRQKKLRKRNLRRSEARRRRSFIFIVLVPVLLMLGSVYLHTVAAETQRTTDALEENISEAAARREALGVREAELSGAERIRSAARDDLGMRDPGAKDFRAYSGDVEDGNSGGSEQRQGETR